MRRLLLLAVLLTVAVPSGQARVTSDLNGDGVVDARDLLLRNRRQDVPLEQFRQDFGLALRPLPVDASRDHLVVRLKPGVDADAFFADREVVPLGYASHLGSWKVAPADGQATQEALARLRRDSGVAFVEPAYDRWINLVPNDPLYPQQWNLDLIRAAEAWDVTTGTRDVVVAVLDSGIAYDTRGQFCAAEDFAADTFVPGFNVLLDAPDALDDNGHGTHVAGTIAQGVNNGIGGVGVAPTVKLMPVKVCESYWNEQTGSMDGRCSSFDVAEGIFWAVDQGADVINLSLGGFSGSGVELDALLYAEQRGVVVVAAAGNAGRGTLNYPAAFPTVLSVGAVSPFGQIAPYSNSGAGLDVVAPGGLDVNSDRILTPDEGVVQETLNPARRYPFNLCDIEFRAFQGTSMAAPHVAAVAALVLSTGTTVSPQEVREVIRRTAQDLGAPGYDPFYGFGLLDAGAAVRYTYGRGW